MAKIKYKYDDNQIFEVYGVRTKSSRQYEDEHEWTETKIYFLIYNGAWEWVDSYYYLAVE